MNEKLLDLSTVGNGAAEELFSEELHTVLENVLDLNTQATAKRKIMLEVVFTPTADRDEMAVDVKVASKLAPLNSAHSTAFVGRKGGKVIAVTHDPRQMQMEFDEEPVELATVPERKEA